MPTFTVASDTSTTFVWDTTTSANGNEMIWQIWLHNTTATSSTLTVDPRVAPWSGPPLELDGAKAAAEFEEARQRRVEAFKAERAADPLGLGRTKEERAQDLARTKAIAILCESLDKAQINGLVKDNSFTVESQHGNLYRIDLGHARNIRRLKHDGRTVVESLCAHPRNAYELPDCDSMLAQLLMIQCSEDAFLKIANRHPVDARVELHAA